VEQGVEFKDVNTYSGLTLAYMGDAVLEQLFRSIIVSRGNAPVAKLHRQAAFYAKASTQSLMAGAIEETLSEEELAAYKRGRNAHPHTKAKNASLSDYRRATGFEALIGYLYITGRQDRIWELAKKGMEAADGV